MSDSSKPVGGGNGALERLGFAACIVFGVLGAVAWTGLRRIKFRSVEFQFLAPAVLLILFALTFANYYHLTILHWIWPGVFTPKFIMLLRKSWRVIHFLLAVLFTLYWVSFVIGFLPFIRNRKFQRDLDSAGLKNAQGLAPKVINVIAVDDNKTKLLVKAKGVGVEKFEGKKSDLESSFEQIIERITTTPNRKMVEILLCKKELIRLLPFEEALVHLKDPYSFLIGESASGILVQDIRELPHLLIAGSTGGGKSAFFRQALICLLQSSPHLQMYLLDLKRGVEVKEFGLLPNVKIAKDESEAVQVLEAVKEEMHRRFAFMEKKGVKKIDPEKHHRDMIVIGIDEASVLYGKTSVSKAKAQLVAKARDLTDEIAKLARAAGIHLIVATQKAIKESLDTKTLENLPGRMVFKMSTHAGSNTALGNVRAYSLPDIKGRGIWAGGNKFIEVQAPFLSENDLEEKCKAIAEQLNGNKNANFQPMLVCEVARNDDTSEFVAEAKPEEVA